MPISLINSDLFRNDGTNQLQRLIPTLMTDYAKIDDRNINDFLMYVYQLSNQVRYYNLNNQEESDWGVFFEDLFTKLQIDQPQSNDEIEASLSKINDVPPHIVLLLAFLKLYTYLQNDLNQLTQKHLDFFYKDILKLKSKPATADKVHLVFEIAKNLKNHLLPAGTSLDAGKDKNGKPLIYKTDREIALNQAKVAELKSIFKETNPSGTQIYKAVKSDSADGKGKPFEGKNSWRPFGEAQSQKSNSERTMQLSEIGFAISSSVLFLKEGKRTIELIIEIKKDTQINLISLSNPFKFYFSGENGWIEPSKVESVKIFSPTIDTRQLLIKLILNPSDEPIVAANSVVLNESFNTQNPVLKVIVNQENGTYDLLKKLEIGNIRIITEVVGLKDLIVQNDESVVESSKPFMPFGSQPSIGSNFYVSSSEAFYKSLIQIKLKFEWHKLPSDLETYYDGYFPISGLGNIDESKYVVKGYFLQDSTWVHISQNTLFGATPQREIIFESGLLNNFNKNKRPVEIAKSFNNQTKKGFVRFELTSPIIQQYNFEAFGHGIFSKVYAEKAIALSKFSGAGTPPTLPQPPYTPQIKTITLDYKAEEMISAGSSDEFWLIEPFGNRMLTEGEEPKLFPVFNENGYLFIGLQNFEPPQTISLLFQIDEGTAKAETANDLLRKEDIQWSYLVNNKWVEIKTADILEDSTEGFQKAGIVMLNIGRLATNQQSILPQNKHWICAKVIKGKKADGAGSISAVYTQAVSANFVLGNVDTSHLKSGLDANKIKKLLVPQAAVKKVEQPFNSFGGQQTENSDFFNTRISERLRHRNRIVSNWDYERLVLEKFPSIFKIKSLSHRKAGEVELVVVPNLINKNHINPLQPRCSTVLLRSIEDYLKNFASPFVKIKISNPIYEEIILDFKVSFKVGKDAGYHTFLLNDEIKRFLSPWAYEEGKDIPFDGKVYKSDILAFVESRQYVDFVTEFYMYHVYQGERRDGKGIGQMLINKDFIINKSPQATIGSSQGKTIGYDFVVGVPVDSTFPSETTPSIIVSALRHNILSLSSGDVTCSEAGSLDGIGSMIVGLDFSVKNII